MGHALDYDDVHAEVRGHPSTVILPALIALGDRGGDGRRFLEAYIVGVEAMARIALALSNEHYERGFHNTATAGRWRRRSPAPIIWAGPRIGPRWRSGWRRRRPGAARPLRHGDEAAPCRAGRGRGVRSLHARGSGRAGNRASLDGPLGYFAVFGQGEERARSRLLRDDAVPRIVSPGLWHKLYPFCSAAYFGWHAAEQIGRFRWSGSRRSRSRSPAERCGAHPSPPVERRGRPLQHRVYRRADSERTGHPRRTTSSGCRSTARSGPTWTGCGARTYWTSRRASLHAHDGEARGRRDGDRRRRPAEGLPGNPVTEAELSWRKYEEVVTGRGGRRTGTDFAAG